MQQLSLFNDCEDVRVDLLEEIGDFDHWSLMEKGYRIARIERDDELFGESLICPGGREIRFYSDNAYLFCVATAKQLIKILG